MDRLAGAPSALQYLKHFDFDLPPSAFGSRE
jgi:hypothetical protein